MKTPEPSHMRPGQLWLDNNMIGHVYLIIRETYVPNCAGRQWDVYHTHFGMAIFGEYNSIDLLLEDCGDD